MSVAPDLDARIQRAALARGSTLRRVFLAVLGSLSILAPNADPVRAQTVGDPLFESRDAWIAAAYLGATGLALSLDQRIAYAARDSAVQHATGLSHVARGFDLLGVPGTILLSGGLYGIGRIAGQDDMADVGLHMGGAIIIAEVATYAVKFLTGRARPHVSPDDAHDFRLGRGFAREDTYRSFPSGHTTAAFAVAAVAAHEVERIHGGDAFLIGLATYGPAAFVGAARVFHDRHWTSDVVLGAAIGAFAGWKVVQYSHTHPDNRIDDWFLAGSITPGDWSSLRIGIVPR